MVAVIILMIVCFIIIGIIMNSSLEILILISIFTSLGYIIRTIQYRLSDDRVLKIKFDK